MSSSRTNLSSSDRILNISSWLKASTLPFSLSMSYSALTASYGKRSSHAPIKPSFVHGNCIQIGYTLVVHAFVPAALYSGSFLLKGVPIQITFLLVGCIACLTAL